MRRVRVGAVGYVNAWPLTARIDRIRYEVVQHHPAHIAADLAHGRLDVGLVPVASVLADGPWKVVPGVAIGSRGPVHSVLLVGRTPPEAWRRVLLDGVSRTSALLTRVLASRGPWARYGWSLEAVPPATSLDGVDDATGALVIGDAARNLPPHLGFRLDLGEAWHAWTSLPFVFAVWAGRPDLPPQVVDDLRQAAREGLALRAALPEPDRTYLLSHIDYRLGDPELTGLRRFAALARELGAAPRSAEIDLYGPGQPRRPRPADLGPLLDDALREPIGPSLALRLVREATLSELQLAADRRRRQSFSTVTWRDLDACPHGPDEAPTRRVVVRSPEAAVQELAGLAASVAAVEIVAGDFRADDAAPTAAELLRVVAVARLLLPYDTHVVVPWTACREAGTAQAALHGGADDLGGVSPSAAIGDHAVPELERALREAGFEPQRRDASFRPAGAALTPALRRGQRASKLEAP